MFMGWTAGKIDYNDDIFPAAIPVNMHVGCMGLAPASHDVVDSIPPMRTGGNIDDKRIGVGTTMYYHVDVAGGLLSMGDAHIAQGDSELSGTGIETSLTGEFKITLVKKADLAPWQVDLDIPVAETDSHWIVHSFTEIDYLAAYPEDPALIYGKSSIDSALKNTFTQTRKFLMAMYGVSDDEATTLITEGVDFGITQV
jgi:acetamidase/formamidase